MVAHQVPHKVDHIKDTHADVQIQGGESSTQEEAGTQPIAKAQVDVNGDASGNEVANIPVERTVTRTPLLAMSKVAPMQTTQTTHRAD